MTRSASSGARGNTSNFSLPPRGRLRRFVPEGSTLTAVSLAASLVLNAFTGVLTARLLGPSGKGVLALAFVWSSVTSVIADLGLSQAATFFASREPGWRRLLWGQLATLTIAQTTLAVPAALVVSSALLHTPAIREAVFVGLIAVPVFLLFGYQLALLRGCERFLEYNLIRVGQSAAWAALVTAFYFVRFPSPMGLILGYVGISTLAFAVGAAVLGRQIGPPRFTIRGTGRVLRYGVLTWVAGIGYQTTIRIDQLFLGAAVSTSALGQYATSVAIASCLTVISTAIAVVTLPAVARSSLNVGLVIGRRNWAFGVVIMTVAAAAVAALAPLLVRVLLGAKFQPAAPLVRILLLGQVALGSTHILHEIARGQGRLRYPAIVETCGAVLTLGLLAFLVPRWGATGAAWASVLVYWPVTVALWMGVLRRPLLHAASTAAAKSEFDRAP
jgi:enterobacterial common antigen flippase